MEILGPAVIGLLLMLIVGTLTFSFAFAGFFTVSLLSLPASLGLLGLALVVDAVLFWRGSLAFVAVFFFAVGVLAGLLWYDLAPVLPLLPAWVLRG